MIRLFCLDCKSLVRRGPTELADMLRVYSAANVVYALTINWIYSVKLHM